MLTITNTCCDEIGNWDKHLGGLINIYFGVRMEGKIGQLQYSLKNFTELTEEEKGMVLDWRNSKRIRSKMINQEIIKKEDHWQWLAGLKERMDCLYFLAYIEGIARGVIDFTEIDIEKKEAFSGLYIGQRDDIGFGAVLSCIMGKYFFQEMNMDVMKALVLKTNNRAYLYNIHCGMLDCPRYSSEEYHCLYLDKKHWLEARALEEDFIERMV